MTSACRLRYEGKMKVAVADAGTAADVRRRTVQRAAAHQLLMQAQSSTVDWVRR